MLSGERWRFPLAEAGRGKGAESHPSRGAVGAGAAETRQAASLREVLLVSRILSMPDSAEQLQRIYLAGFEVQTFERYPKCIGVVLDGCVALLVPGVDGLQILGTPGWRMGGVMGVLTEREGRKVFQAKSEIVEATPERLALLQRFRQDLAKSMSGETSDP